MDAAYKIRADWFPHGDGNSVAVEPGQHNSWNDEILGLYKAARCTNEDLVRKGLDDSEAVESNDQKEDEFLAKLAEGETPLYPVCVHHSKLSAIVSLFRIKTHNGWSDKSFSELLETLPNMLSEDNVLHTSTYDIKKFL
ncbi:unnamed protein product [Microthlaspi erraticum]|uniref:Uncharacterized protein n=1 Tax=Microthlaspi erraticum TaxID=1685480 RepID=A0A6D2JMP1_9BRAS|nr:unnamed protein product [Microthlaspi erraticum]